MRGRFNPLARLTRAHICDYPFIELGPPIGLAHHMIGLLAAQMSAESSIMSLIEDSILKFLIMRNNDARSILSIRAIAQQTLID